jgi:acyl-CoA thioester hydrolase
VGYRHHHRVRYGEVDAQRVVYNAHYLAICDDAVEEWFASLPLEAVVPTTWDFMLKRATVEWQGSAGLRAVITVDVAVERWGTTSFDLGFVGTVGERAVFTAVITYVGVRPGTTEPLSPPEAVRRALGEPGAAARP